MKYPSGRSRQGDTEDISVPKSDESEEIDTTQSTPAQEGQDEFDEPSENGAINDPQESQSRERSDHHVTAP